MTKAETKHNACFPAGTRITTDKGLKRIEDIQVGDMVLSKHESGIGKQEF
ncbi:Hint domain-containing protein, partial [Moraxella caprae]